MLFQNVWIKVSILKLNLIQNEAIETGISTLKNHVPTAAVVVEDLDVDRVFRAGYLREWTKFQNENKDRPAVIAKAKPIYFDLLTLFERSLKKTSNFFLIQN